MDLEVRDTDQYTNKSVTADASSGKKERSRKMFRQ